MFSNNKEQERPKGKMLITTDAWFIAPDGRSYCAAWGNVEIVGDDVLGIKTNARSTNWYAIIGNAGKSVIIAGCQIHYAVECPVKPPTGEVQGWCTTDTGVNVFNKPSSIYIAE